MRAQILACILILAILIAAMKYGLREALTTWGFGTHALICIAITAGAIAIAFAHDRAGARSPRRLQPKPNDHQPRSR